MTDGLNPFHAGRFGDDELPEALRTFAALKLRNKVCSLADAVVQIERFLDRQGQRRLSHPGDWNGEYGDFLAMATLSLRGLGLREPTRNRGVLIMGDCPDSRFLQAMGVELSENEDYFVSHRSGIRIASEPRTSFFPRRNTFAALIGGSDVRLKLDGRWSLHSSLGSFIYRDTGLAKLLQAVVGYKKVFVGAYCLFEPGGTAADEFHTAVAESRLCIESRDFQYVGKPYLAYAAGVEFPC